MSVKERLHSLSKLYSIDEEVPKSFSDGTDVDKYFHQIVCDNSKSHQRMIGVGKSSNKNKLVSSVFPVCDKKTQQR